LTFCVAVHYPSGPINSLFGSSRGMDGHVHFQFVGHTSLFSEASTRDAQIQEGHTRFLRSVFSTAIFEGSNRPPLRKPIFMFGDAALDTGTSCWPRHSSGSSKLRKISIISPRWIDIILYPSSSQWQWRGGWIGVWAGAQTRCKMECSSSLDFLVGTRLILGLHPSLVKKEVPVGKILAMARTFLNYFIKDKGDYPGRDFWSPGWIHSSKKQWWSQIHELHTDEFEIMLMWLELYKVVWATAIW